MDKLIKRGKRWYKVTEKPKEVKEVSKPFEFKKKDKKDKS